MAEDDITIREPIYIDLKELRYIDRINDIHKRFSDINKLIEYVKQRACYLHSQPVLHSYYVIVIGKNETVELEGDFYSGIPLDNVLEIINYLI